MSGASDKEHNATHALKTLPTHLEAVWQRTKRAELRFTGDRAFRVGDEIQLHEFDPETESYTGRSVEAEITHIVRGPDYGLAKDWAMLSFDIKAMTNARRGRKNAV